MIESPARPTGRRWTAEQGKAWFEVGLLAVGLIAHALLLKHENRSDGNLRFQALSELLSHGQLVHLKYSLLGPLLATPLWLIGKAFGDPLWWTLRFNTIVLGVGMLVLYRLLRTRVEPALLRKFFLLLVFGSMFANHLLLFYGEVLTAVLVAVGCVAATLGPRMRGWATILLGVVNTPAAIAGLATLTTAETLRTRRIRYLSILLAGGFLLLYANLAQRGSVFDTGYVNDRGLKSVMPYSGEPGLSNPVFFGVLSLLFSPGKGLVFFTPALFLPVRHALGDRGVFAVHRTWLWFLAGLLLIYSAYWAWPGGWFWGPRYLLFAAIPASFVLAARIHRPGSALGNVVTLGVLCLSLWVGINGAVFGDRALFDICGRDPSFEFAFCYNTPAFSPLWYPFRVWPSLPSGSIIYLAYSLAVALYLIAPFAITTTRIAVAAARAHGWSIRTFRV